MKELANIFTALTYFTRIPLYRFGRWEFTTLTAGLKYFPLVGAINGSLMGVVYYLSNLCFSPPVAVICGILTGVLFTGALHEDGLADFCDGFGGGKDPLQRLQIMKDSRVGVYGVLGLIFLFLFKFSALYSFGPKNLIIACFLGQVVSRFLTTTIVCTLKYVQDPKVSKALDLKNSSLTGRQLFESSLLTLLLVGPAFYLLCVNWPLPPLFLFGSFFIFSLFIIRRELIKVFYKNIGGYTGDCLGAAVMFFEIWIYLCLLIGIKINAS